MAEADYPFLRPYPSTLQVLEHRRICEEEARIAALHSHIADPLDIELERLQKIQAIERMRQLNYWEQIEIDEQIRMERLNNQMLSEAYTAEMEKEQALLYRIRGERSKPPYADNVESDGERELMERYKRNDRVACHKGKLQQQYDGYREGFSKPIKQYEPRIASSHRVGGGRQHTQSSKTTQTRREEPNRKKLFDGTDYTPVKVIQNKFQQTPLKQPTFQNSLTPAARRSVTASKAAQTEQSQQKADISLSNTQAHTAQKWLKSSIKRSHKQLQKHYKLDRNSPSSLSQQKKTEGLGSHQAAMQLIRNRMKVSEVVYRDSQMRTIKHEMDHLYNTYHNEVNGRQDIKDKINSHPEVLRHHQFVVPTN